MKPNKWFEGEALAWRNVHRQAEDHLKDHPLFWNAFYLKTLPHLAISRRVLTPLIDSLYDHIDADASKESTEISAN